MLDTLERSVAAQRQLVADASHELRTPITSLRTNIEVLAESEALPPDERARLLARRRGADHRAGHARRGPDRARPRRRAVPGARGHPPRRPRPRGRHPRQAPRPVDRLPRAAGAGGPRRHPRTPRAARSTTCSTTPPSTPHPAASSRSTPARPASASATTAPASTPRTSPTSSTASTAAPPPAAAPAPASASPSSARSPSSTAAPSAPPTPPPAEPSSPSPSPPPPRRRIPLANLKEPKGSDPFRFERGEKSVAADLWRACLDHRVPNSPAAISSRVLARRRRAADLPRRPRPPAVSLVACAQSIRRTGWRCLAYCLMGNHMHLLIETPQPNLGRGMQRLHGDVRPSVQPSARGCRVTCSRSSVQARRASSPTRSCGSPLRYIARNPVEAGFCSAPEAWPWSSHARDRSPRTRPPGSTTDGSSSYFAQDGGDALRTYREFVAALPANLKGSDPFKFGRMTVPERPVLVAPDKFKGTFNAAQVAAAIGRGLEKAGLMPPDLCPGRGWWGRDAGRVAAAVGRGVDREDRRRAEGASR